MEETYLWHLWPGRHWPASPKEERHLVTELKHLSPTPALSFERADVTAVLNILRLGLSFADAKKQAPGLIPARLLSAYQHLEERRARAASALTLVMRAKSPSEIQGQALFATSLAPLPTYRALSGAQTYDASPKTPADTKALAAQIRHIRSLIAAANVRAITAQKQLEALGVPSDPEERLLAVRLGRRLYDPYADCLWAAQFYVPRRVTDLVPGRVGDLLGEDF
jgi:hypothetical protein